jgi:hypothetical protein
MEYSNDANELHELFCSLDLQQSQVPIKVDWLLSQHDFSSDKYQVSSVTCHHWDSILSDETS